MGAAGPACAAREPLSREPLSREPLSREPLSREPLSREPLSREPLSREPLSREPLSREPLSREPLSREPLSREPLSREPLSREPLSREPLSREPLSREPLSREPLSREPLSREPLSREPLSREPLSREPALRSVLRHVRLENLAAGMSGGVLSTLALHPLDLVKIRFAVSDGLELRPKYHGILHCMSTVWKHEGLRGLYQGVTPNMVGAGASWGLYFFFYNAIKAYKKEGKMESLSASEHLVSAAEAGAMTLCITNPIWVTKTRLVLQYNAGVDPSKRQYRGMFDALIKIYKTEGIRGLYKVLHRDISISGFGGNIFHPEGIKMTMATSVSCLHKLSEQGTQMLQVSDTLRAQMKAALERLQGGFVPGLFGTSHGALQFMAYEDLKERYNEYRNRVSDTKLNTVEYIMMAAVSKIFAVVATYPYQVVRARLQDQHNTYSGVFDVIRRTWRKEGVHGFYKGIIPNVIRVTPACCITFVVYENVSGFLLGFRKENN